MYVPTFKVVKLKFTIALVVSQFKDFLFLNLGYLLKLLKNLCTQSFLKTSQPTIVDEDR